MPNPIRYTTSSFTTQSQALKSGNFWIGTNDITKGETSNTDYWNSITPPDGGYTIYLGRASNGPIMYVAANSSELVTLTNRIIGTNFTTASQCLAYFATQSTSKVLNKDIEPIITNGLVFNLDATLSPSNPGTSSTWYNISGFGNNATLFSAPNGSGVAGGSQYTFNSSSQSSISFTTSPTMSISNNGGYSSITSYSELNNISSTSEFTFTCNFLINSYLRQLYPAESDTSNSVGLLVKGSFSPSYGIDLIFQSPTPSTSGTFSVVYPRYGIRNSAGTIASINTVTTLPLVLNEWYNAAFTHTYTGTTLSGTHSMIFYVNGASFSTLQGTFVDFANTSNVNINNGVLGTNNIRGNITIANSMIYNRALSQSEVVQNYKAYISSRILNSSIIIDGLILLLDASYGSSYPRSGNTWFDISGSDNKGTLNNGPIWANTNSGQITFDGVDDSMDFKNIINFDDATAFTCEIVINIPTFVQSLSRVHWLSGVGGNSMMIIRSSNFFMWNEAGGVNSATINYTFNTNTNYHVTITRDTSNLVTLYVNGISSGTASRDGQFRWSTFGRLGSSNTFCSNFRVYKSAIYNKALSASEVLQNFNATKNRYGL